MSHPDHHTSDPEQPADDTEEDLYLSLVLHHLRLLAGSAGPPGELTPERLTELLAAALGETAPGAQQLSVLANRLLAAGYAKFIDEQQREADQQAEAERRWQAFRESQVYLGAPRSPTGALPEIYSALGWRLSDARRVALARQGGQLILMAGALGSGKSQTITTLTEGLLRPIPGITSEAHQPTSVMSFSYVPDGRRLPDILEALRPNGSALDLGFLQEHYAAGGAPIDQMRLILPKWLLPEYEERLRPYRDLGLQVLELRLRLPQLALSSIEVLVGGDPDAAYIQALLEKAQELGEKLRIGDLCDVVEGAGNITSTQKRLALSRLGLLGRIASDEHDLWDMVAPGVYSVFLLGGRWIRDAEALPLIVALMNGLGQPSPRHGAYQRVTALDEVNRYEHNRLVTMHLLTAGRQIRHGGGMLILAGQDFISLPDKLVGLATIAMQFRTDNRAAFADLVARHAGFSGRRFEEVHALERGAALVAAAESTDPEWRRAQAMKFRPPLCQHGGATKSEL